MSADARALADLEGVGSATLGDFALLGVSNVPQLATCEAQELYNRLCRITHQRHDHCCLDVFRCAIAQARDPELPSEQRKWWYWSRVRKGQAATQHA